METKEGSSVEKLEAVVDPGEGQGAGGAAPIIFRPKLIRAPPYLRVWLTTPLPLIGRSGSATERGVF